MCTSLFSSIIHIIRKVETDKWTNEIQYICIHIMWYYSVIKGMRCWYMQQYNKLCENLVKWTKPDIEPQILYDPTYALMWALWKSQVQRDEKQMRGCPAWEMRSSCVLDTEFPLGWWEILEIMMMVAQHCECS